MLRLFSLALIVSIASASDVRKCKAFWDDYAKGRNPSRNEYIEGLKALVGTSQITYSQDQTKRWSGINGNVCWPSLPSFADCSSFTTWAYWTAFGEGKDAVNNCGWTAGYSGTMEKTGTKVKYPDECLPGDTVLYEGHVATYAGDEKIINYGSTGPVKLLNAVYDSNKPPLNCLRFSLDFFGENSKDDDVACTCYTTTATSLNFRDGPGMTYNVLYAKPENTEICVVSINDGWAKLNTDEYCSAKYIRVCDVHNEATNAEKGTPGWIVGIILIALIAVMVSVVFVIKLKQNNWKLSGLNTNA